MKIGFTNFLETIFMKIGPVPGSYFGSVASYTLYLDHRQTPNFYAKSYFSYKNKNRIEKTFVKKLGFSAILLNSLLPLPDTVHMTPT